MEIIIVILIILMIIAAIIALEIRDLLSSIVSLGSVGIILTFIFLLLQAPDLAIVQFVVEILSLVVLIRGPVKRDEEVYSKQKFLSRAPILLSLVVFLYFIVLGLKYIPQFGFPKYKLAEYYVKNAIGETGAVNVVASIILNYRAYDTLGEATVLFTAILGAVAILRKIGKIKK
jgi:multicomponent Na+:H+ antiporter subunit B